MSLPLIYSTLRESETRRKRGARRAPSGRLDGLGSSRSLCESGSAPSLFRAAESFTAPRRRRRPSPPRAAAAAPSLAAAAARPPRSPPAPPADPLASLAPERSRVRKLGARSLPLEYVLRAAVAAYRRFRLAPALAGLAASAAALRAARRGAERLVARRRFAAAAAAARRARAARLRREAAARDAAGGRLRRAWFAYRLVRHLRAAARCTLVVRGAARRAVAATAVASCFRGSLGRAVVKRRRRALLCDELRAFARAWELPDVRAARYLPPATAPGPRRDEAWADVESFTPLVALAGVPLSAVELGAGQG